MTKGPYPAFDAGGNRESFLASGALTASIVMPVTFMPVIFMVVILMLIGPTAGHASGSDTMLGVLEDVPDPYGTDAPVRAVRILFQKKAGDWQAFPSSCPDQSCLKTIASEFPHSVTWTIGFSGRILGQVAGVRPNEYAFYSDIGLQKIASDKSVPTVGPRSQDFAGYLGVSVLRPLIANSEPDFRDPDSWKADRPTRALAKTLRSAFRKQYSDVVNCAESDAAPPPSEYRDQDIRIIKVYSSGTGWHAAQMLLSGYGCEGEPEDAFLDQWFVLSPAGDIAFLGTGMQLVDAGDYDNDGKSEIVFSIDRDNEGGYVLFYDGFAKRAAFEFNYH